MKKTKKLIQLKKEYKKKTNLKVNNKNMEPMKELKTIIYIKKMKNNKILNRIIMNNNKITINKINKIHKNQIKIKARLNRKLILRMIF